MKPQINVYVKEKEVGESIATLMEASVKLACIAYLKPECMSCVADDMNDHFGEFFEKYGHLLGSEEEGGTLQFYRQVVIWSKETAEAKLKQPCSLEGMTPLLKEIVIGLKRGDEWS